MRSARIWLWIGVALSLAFAATVLRGQRIGQEEVAAALQQALASRPKAIRPGIWPDVRHFYEARGGAAAWVAGRNFAQVEEALRLIRRAPEHGLEPSDYDDVALTVAVDRLRQIGREPDSNRAPQLAELDLRVTAALLSLGHDVTFGRTGPERLHPNWKSRRAAVDLPASLNECVDAGLSGWLDQLKPRHPEYAALQKALEELRAVQKNGGWPKVTATILRPGASGSPVASLRDRLSASGDLASNPAASSEYDEEVQSAVRRFQDRHGLTLNGIADTPTIAAMNVSVGARIQQVELNLERWRWMPDDFGPRYVLVNIPAYRFELLENGRSTMAMRAIVGDPRHRTPVFSAMMTTVIFSPYWNIPETIAEGEVAPKMARDPGYLARNNIDILRVTKTGTSTVDPDSIDWSNPGELEQLAFRQRPGSSNALGHVKFLLPNPYNVYLHDTPAAELFARPVRALSHGCIRLQEPESLAKYLLRDDPEWDEERMDAAMAGGVETPVKLKQSLPVHIVYFSVWPDERGGLSFFPDIYRYDQLQAGR